MDGKAERVKRLRGRMGKGRERLGGLVERLDRVRERVEKAERRDEDDRVRVGRRWRVFWGLVGVWIGVLVVGLVLRQLGPQRPVTEQVGKAEALLEGMSGGGESLRVDDNGKGDNVTESNRDGLDGGQCRQETVRTVDVDATLRLFDEL